METHRSFSLIVFCFASRYTIGGHSITTWRKVHPILITYLLERTTVDILHAKSGFFSCNKAWTLYTNHLPTSSYPRSYWMPLPQRDFKRLKESIFVYYPNCNVCHLLGRDASWDPRMISCTYYLAQLFVTWCVCITTKDLRQKQDNTYKNLKKCQADP